MKLATFFISRTELIFVKTLTVPESTFKMKSIIRWLLSEILLNSAVVCKQRCLHKNEIVQYLQNY